MPTYLPSYLPTQVEALEITNFPTLKGTTIGGIVTPSPAGGSKGSFPSGSKGGFSKSGQSTPTARPTKRMEARPKANKKKCTPVLEEKCRSGPPIDSNDLILFKKCKKCNFSC
jgi:hypothetical protein